jgi:outer membrane protein TolC
LTFEFESLQKVEAEQKSTIEKLSNKQGLASDTLRTGLNVRNAILLEMQAKDAVKLSLSYLGQQIGASETTEIVVNDRLQTRKNPAIPNLSDDSATYRNQPAFLAEETQIALATAQRKKLNYQYLPTVSAYGYYAGQAFRKEPDFYSTSGNWYPVGYWGIKASWTIFDGFQKKAQDRQQLLAIGKSEATKTSLKQSIAYDRLNALNSMRNATRNMDYQTNNVEVANKLYDLARQKVREGQGLQQEVTEAEYTLKQTQQLYLQSVYDYLIADLEYMKASGRL